MQPDEDTTFGRHLKVVTRYLNIGVPSFTGTYNATLPEEASFLELELESSSALLLVVWRCRFR